HPDDDAGDALRAAGGAVQQFGLGDEPASAAALEPEAARRTLIRDLVLRTAFLNGGSRGGNLVEKDGPVRFRRVSVAGHAGDDEPALAGGALPMADAEAFQNFVPQHRMGLAAEAWDVDECGEGRTPAIGLQDRRSVRKGLSIISRLGSEETMGRYAAGRSLLRAELLEKGLQIAVVLVGRMQAQSLP